MGDSGPRCEHPPENRLWGGDRLVLYLEAPVLTLDDVDGSRRDGIRTATETFLDSPESAFDKYPGQFIGHIRHLDTKMRAFATWCQNESVGCELCVVHEIYRKDNEDAYWRDLDDYDEAGGEFARQFRSLSPERYDEWLEEMRVTDGVLLVGQ